MSLQLKEYRRKLSNRNEENIFLLPWGGLVCRNCDDSGDLISYKSITDFRSGDKPLWLVLSLVLFTAIFFYFIKTPLPVRNRYKLLNVSKNEISFYLIGYYHCIRGLAQAPETENVGSSKHVQLFLISKFLYFH